MAFGSGAKFRFARVLASVALVLAFFAGNVAPTLAAGGTNGSIQGTITDASGPVAGANVTIASGSQTVKTTTASNGFFVANNLPVDTYTVSVEAKGYQALVLRGVNVQGDATAQLGNQQIAKQTAVIGRVASRNVAGAVVLTQTVDQVTISGERLTQASGKAFNSSIAQLAQAAPGVTLTSGGNLSIRGSRSSDVGYQFEGIDFREPQANGLAINVLNGLNSIQVVGGAGDATQGNVGSGVINFTIKRGTYPAFGSFDLEDVPVNSVFGPQSSHQEAFEYGFATKDNRFSNYVSILAQQNGDPNVAISYPTGGSAFSGCGINPLAQSARNVGCFYGASLGKNIDIVDNFIYRFGANQDQSLQILYRNSQLDVLGNLGGLTGLNGGPSSLYYPYAPNYIAGVNPYDDGSGGVTPGYSVTAPGYTPVGVFQSQISLLPGVPASSSTGGSIPSSLNLTNRTLSFLDFAYTKQFGASSALTVRAYNWFLDITQDRSAANGAAFAGFQGTGSYYNQLSGGQVTGQNFDFTTQLGQRNTLTIDGKFENTHPFRDQPTPLFGYFAAETGNLTPGDWVSPANTTLPVSAANPCPVVGGCYLYSYGLAHGNLFGGQAVGRLPSVGVGYNGADYQFWGAGIRDVIQLGSRLRFDVGGRFDGANYKQKFNPYADPAFQTPNNPQDVAPATVTPQFTNPVVFQPRIGFSFEITKNDSIRAEFARTTNLIPGQGFGTPFQTFPALNPALLSIPATDTVAAPACGSGANPRGFYKCSNYAQQFYWAADQVDAPDVGGTLPPKFSNYDLTLQHQFKNGMGLRLTGFYKRGYDLGDFTPLTFGPPGPDGNPSFTIYAAASTGIERTTGAEMYFTLPTVAKGFSGFVSATYINALSNIPPGASGEEGVSPVYSAAAGANNVFYRVGFISPVVARTGISYKVGKFKINPIVAFNNGFPATVGNTAPFGINGGGVGFLNGSPTIVPSSNLGLAIPNAFVAGAPTGAAVSPNFIDPVNPGSYLHPNYAATRGTNEGNNTGSVLSKPRMGVDMSFEYQLTPKSLIGVYVGNIFNNPYGLSALQSGVQPNPNSRYQAVAQGVPGPMTGTSSTSFGANGSFVNGGSPYLPIDCGTCPYVVPAAGTGRTARVYYQLQL
jgi:hypothetical protein